MMGKILIKQANHDGLLAGMNRTKYMATVLKNGTSFGPTLFSCNESKIFILIKVQFNFSNFNDNIFYNIMRKEVETQTFSGYLLSYGAKRNVPTVLTNPDKMLAQRQPEIKI